MYNHVSIKKRILKTSLKSQKKEKRVTAEFYFSLITSSLTENKKVKLILDAVAILPSIYNSLTWGWGNSSPGA
jgi:hypothetical protein